MRRRSAARRGFAGAIGGIAGAWAMARFGAAWQRATRRRRGAGRRGIGAERDWTHDDRTAALLAQAVSARVLNRQLRSDELMTMIPLVRYGYGAAAGAVYALVPGTIDRGLVAAAAWGIALSLIGDELVVPALDRSVRTDDTVMAKAQALATHIVYGMTTHLVRRAAAMVV